MWRGIGEAQPRWRVGRQSLLNGQVAEWLKPHWGNLRGCSLNRNERDFKKHIVTTAYLTPESVRRFNILLLTLFCISRG